MVKSFAIATIINNCITILLYWILMQQISPEIAYLITWIIGLTIVFIFYPKIIFNQDFYCIKITNLSLLAGYVFSLCITLIYIHCIEESSKLFIAISSAAVNGILNLLIIHLTKISLKDT
jgi:hypothetical protein